MREPTVRGRAAAGERGKAWRWKTSDATRDRILAAALALFAERGYGNVRLTEVLARADMSTGSFYHHFTAKQDLLTELWRGYCRGQDQARRKAEAAARRAGTGDPAAVWEAGTRGVLEDAWRNRRLAALFTAGEVPADAGAFRRDRGHRSAADTGPIPEQLSGAEGDLYASCLQGLVQTGVQAVVDARDTKEAHRLIDATVGYCLQFMAYQQVPPALTGHLQGAFRAHA